MAVIDCNNRPDFTIQEVRGSGYLYSAEFTEASSISDLTTAYAANALNEIVPAIEEYGTEETVETLAQVYAELLTESKINAYNTLILNGATNSENALNSLESITNPRKVSDIATISSSSRDLFFENQFPAVHQRINIGVISPIEFAEFARDSSFTDMSQIKDQTKNNRFNLLSLLNLYFGGAALSQLLGSVCNILSNPFSGLSGLIQSGLNSIESVMALKYGFLGLLEKAAKLLDIGKAVSKIKSFQEMIGKAIVGLVDSVKRKVENVISNINTTINSVLNGSAISTVSNFIQNKVRQVQNFFSEKNMENLVTKVKDSIGKFANQFKNFSSKVADYILTSMCKVQSTVQDFLEAPVKSLENMLSGTTTEVNTLKNISNVELKKSIEGGRPSITESSKKKKVDQWSKVYKQTLIDKANRDAQEERRSAPGSTSPDNIEENASANRSKEYNYIPSKAAHPSPTEWKWLTFGQQVLDPIQKGQKFWDADFKVEMVDYGGGFAIPSETGIKRDVGYYGIELEVLERAEALGESLGTKITVTSGFRHLIYNQYLRNNGVGAAKASSHTKGKALDCVMGRGSYREKFIKMARVHGFKGIGRYRTFVHIDLGPTRTWGS
tara:strand:+ start:13924 stop:15759 length:1836 start_codon:yes stop_codon:yes gene_type:complete